ncbi:MAG: 3-keto-5-aminohexanoate cleavage protein, partial [Proteobacteria bacterium]|nr:3-keto-5-aminohexanoate cleavage protein [Pseudomonadota bacterium]
MTEAMPQPTDWPPLVIAVAPNGARKTKADHPALPMTADDLADTAVKCAEAGAAMIHLHVRDAAGGHTLDVAAYRAATKAIRDRLGDGIIIQATSEAVGRYQASEQMAMVRTLRPEAVSMAIRELIPTDKDEETAAEFLQWVVDEGIQPQYILYAADEVVRYADLIKQGVIPAKGASVLYVLGRYSTGQVSHPADLLPFLDVAGALECHWGFCAFGPREGACAMMVAALGGHVRVGFENNRWLNDGRLAPD